MTLESNCQVWLVDLALLRPALESLDGRAGLLSSDESAAEASSETARNRRAARIALRLLLVRAGVRAGLATPLLRDPGGKPRIAGAGLEFSVSHAGGHALIALSHSGPVGVDLESLRTVRIREPRRSQILAVGAALAGPPYHRPIRGEYEDRELLRAWTRLEALSKARGSGIGRLLADLGIAGSGARDLPAEAAAGNARRLAATEGIAVCDLTLPRDLLGALAARPGAVSAAASVARLTVEDRAE